MAMYVEPVILEGQHVRLEPLSPAHAPDLLTAAQHDDIWRYMPTPRPYSLEDMQGLIQTALNTPGRFPFATIDLTTGKAIGSTSYLDVQPANYGLEIGWTWLGRDFWKSARNTECKYLLLGHAFDTLGAIRVQLKTDMRNYISQNAIERIGAVREGVLRRNMILYSGYVRDSVYFSILDSEWSTVKANLELKLAAYSKPAGVQS